MSTENRDRFTAEEWVTIRQLPELVVAAAAAVERDTGIGGTREVVTGLTEILNGARLRRDNALVQAVFEEYKQDGAGEGRILELSEEPPAGLIARTLAQCAAANALLDAKAAGDAPEFKQWLLETAEQVAAAATSGGFLGFGGDRVTAAEGSFLVDLYRAFGLERAA